MHLKDLLSLVSKAFLFSFTLVPPVRLLFMNHFNFKRFVVSQIFLYQFVQFAFRWKADRYLASERKKREETLAKNNKKFKAMTDSMHWLDSRGQSHLINDIQHPFLLVAFIHQQDQTSLINQFSAIASQDVGLFVVFLDNQTDKLISEQPVFIGYSNSPFPRNTYLGYCRASQEVFFDKTSGREQLKGLVAKFNRSMARYMQGK